LRWYFLKKVLSFLLLGNCMNAAHNKK